MSELGIRVTSEVGFQFLPIALIIPDTFAGRADRQKTMKDLNATERLSKFADHFKPLVVRRLLLGNIPRNTGCTDAFPLQIPDRGN